MAEGNDAFLGLGVPLVGESEIKQDSPVNDIITITGSTGQEGDFLICQTVDGTERFGIHNSGRVQLRVLTTRPTTGLTKGEMMLLFHNDTPKLGICSSTAAQTIKMVSLKTATFGRLTA